MWYFFPFAFHIAVQQPFKPLWSRLLLYDLEPTLSIICSTLQVITDDAASGIRGTLSKFPSSRYLSSSGSYPLDLSGVGDPAGSNATAGLALRVTGTQKPFKTTRCRYHRRDFLIVHQIIKFLIGNPGHQTDLLRVYTLTSALPSVTLVIKQIYYVFIHLHLLCHW
jgi:hypothetical protein